MQIRDYSQVLDEELRKDLFGIIFDQLFEANDGPVNLNELKLHFPQASHFLDIIQDIFSPTKIPPKDLQILDLIFSDPRTHLRMSYPELYKQQIYSALHKLTIMIYGRFDLYLLAEVVKKILEESDNGVISIERITREVYFGRLTQLSPEALLEA